MLDLHSRNALRAWAIGLALSTTMLSAAAQAQDSSSAPGVNPKDNLSKTELIYRYDDLDLGGNIQSLTFKHDVALNANWGINVEVPTVSFSGFGLNEAGLGDTQVRLRYTSRIGNVPVIAGAELVLPTATDDTLGRGRVQLNPAVGAVFQTSPLTFVFLGYKHSLSVGGSSSRADINESQPRILAAYTSPQGWWLTGDAKFTKDWESGSEQLDLEVEYGRMINANTGVWARAGTSLLDSDRTAGILFGIRFIN